MKRNGPFDSDYSIIINATEYKCSLCLHILTILLYLQYIIQYIDM